MIGGCSPSKVDGKARGRVCRSPPDLGRQTGLESPTLQVCPTVTISTAAAGIIIIVLFNYENEQGGDPEEEAVEDGVEVDEDDRPPSQLQNLTPDVILC